MESNFGIPPVFTPFTVRLMAAVDAPTARAVLGVSSTGGGGAGVPDGGATDEFLAKASSANGDVKWTNKIDGGYY